jgi:hypothetical protein
VHASEDVREPVDPEVVPSLERSELRVLAVVAFGAVVGSIARYAFERSFSAARVTFHGRRSLSIWEAASRCRLSSSSPHVSGRELGS